MSMTIEQNKAVIKQFLEAWNNREADGFDHLVAADAVRRHCQATPAVAVRSLVLGLTGIALPAYVPTAAICLPPGAGYAGRSAAAGDVGALRYGLLWPLECLP